MNITLHVRPDVARALRDDGSNDAAEPLRETVRELGARLAPAQPDTSDAELATVFILDLPESTDPIAATARLRGLAAVEAAYVKPADEPPGI